MVLSPEQNQPAFPRHILRDLRLAKSEKLGWQVTALLHEALHLPGIRRRAREGEVLAAGATHAGAQYTGSLSGALTSECRHRRSGKGWTGV